MQSAPGGSTKTVVDPNATKREPASPAPTRRPASADGIFQNGVLTVAGADPDNQTAPAKFSKRTDAADDLPIAAYALRHLRPEQRNRIHESLQKGLGKSRDAPPVEPVVGAEVSSNVAVEGVPEGLVQDFPELKGLAFVGDRNRIVLLSPTMHRVLGVIEE
jgi:hypothetical protein